MIQQPSKNFINLCCNSEKCKLTAYVDTGGVLTIGYGHTGIDVKPEMTITQEQAEKLFISDCAVFIRCLNKYQFDINQNQFGAILDLIYNIGPGNFAKDTALVNAIKTKSGAQIVAAFNKHVYDKFGAKQPGLVTRRQREINLYFQ